MVDDAGKRHGSMGICGQDWFVTVHWLPRTINEKNLPKLSEIHNEGPQSQLASSLIGTGTHAVIKAPQRTLQVVDSSPRSHRDQYCQEPADPKTQDPSYSRDWRYPTLLGADFDYHFASPPKARLVSEGPEKLARIHAFAAGWLRDY
ncbi:uncharacterized protein LACBIDRAFT_329626 [Laccaria bicolor S238N-H82]|uniref:Predicted protein n=1 Tax=Laccaria bicolor (strain S238N-H82 / ATCC MYA-4686) TaxID=486041 RepID=B0DIM5_LACBS|nr:uncharacterized protein LACBIDRAFT_329626 [Laccaria bicolor S238N-H82]EDR05596.1 predicted protein [Laccaria bicolor S238N-H82]|eukprot:XP_001883700.1 predicted protein [Laccaria bicolor S238N-H82]